MKHVENTSATTKTVAKTRDENCTMCDIVFTKTGGNNTTKRVRWNQTRILIEHQ